MNMLVDGEWRTDMFQATNEEGFRAADDPVQELDCWLRRAGAH